ncbi:hypothetical protein [Burkholderia alba]|uniref:hypothetical protein n=1 Tax=Burkholderia alba TaxID=2683677 RepID=UPI002B053FEF|nr:hypothetical protein [Burkholderia alba]
MGEDFSNVLNVLVGQIIFSAKRSHGSYFMLEVGSPSLRIRDPIESSDGKRQDARRLLQRRRVFVVGDWSFLVCECYWKILIFDEEVNQSSNSNKIDEILALCEGQIIKSIERCTEEYSLSINFDGLGKLILQPNIKYPTEDQWRLFFADRSSVGLSNNGDLVREAGQS